MSPGPEDYPEFAYEDFSDELSQPGPPEEDVPDPSKTLNLDTNQLGWDAQSQELAWLLSIAIERLGGALVITQGERARRPHYSLGVDVKFTNDTGGIRIFAVLQGEEGVDG